MIFAKLHKCDIKKYYQKYSTYKFFFEFKVIRKSGLRGQKLYRACNNEGKILISINVWYLWSLFFQRL